MQKYRVLSFFSGLLLAALPMGGVFGETKNLQQVDSFAKQRVTSECGWRNGMNLADILIFALCNNIELKGLSQDVRVLHSEENIARTSYMPVLSGKAGMPLHTPGGIHNLPVFSVESSIELWDGGRRHSKLRRNRFYSNAAGYKLETQKYYVALKCVEIYHSIWAAHQRLSIVENLHSLSVSSLLVSESLVNEGLISQLDHLRLQAIERKYASRLFEIQANANEVERSFKVFLGVGQDQKIPLVKAVEGVTSSYVEDEEVRRIFKTYYLTDPRVRELEQMQGVYMSEAEQTSSSMKPIIALHGGLTSGGSSVGNLWSASLSLTLPIWDAGHKHRMAISKLKISRADLNLAAGQISTDSESSRYKERFNELHKKLRVAEQYVELTRRHFNSMSEKYGFRMATVTELVDSYESFLNASETMIEAAREYRIDKLTSPCYLRKVSSAYDC